MAVTLKDIAEKVGVSPTTVSLVLNQKDDNRISDATKHKIMEAVKELGYQPSKVTPNIVQNVPPTIGFVITDIENPFFTKLASVVEDIASRYGYNIILCNTRRDLNREREFLEVLWRRRVDGLIIAPVDDEESDLQAFFSHDIPVVFVDRCPQKTQFNAVLLNNIEGAYMAIDYLINLGHKRIGIIVGRRNTTTGRDRLRGYIKALKDHGLEMNDWLMKDGHYSIEGGKQATEELLRLAPPPSAIFSSGGVMTIGVLLALKENNVNIPEDVSLISFDDEQWYLFIDPPLTAVSQPVNELGTEAAHLVIQSIQGWGTTGEPQKIVLQPELIIRESCREYHA